MKYLVNVLLVSILHTVINKFDLSREIPYTVQIRKKRMKEKRGEKEKKITSISLYPLLQLVTENLITMLFQNNND